MDDVDGVAEVVVERPLGVADIGEHFEIDVVHDESGGVENSLELQSRHVLAYDGVGCFLQLGVDGRLVARIATARTQGLEQVGCGAG